MPSDVSWLPDWHLSIAATLAHADDLLARLTDVLFEYSTQPKGTIGLREVRHGQVFRTTVTAIAPLPRSIPLYAADVLTTLRAAVEHTLYAEVEHANLGPLTDEESRAVEMPAATTWEKFEEWVTRVRRRAPKPMRQGSPLLDRVRRLQPYQRTQSASEHPMALLAAHSNLAKHRMPAVAALRLAAIRPDDGRVDPRVRIPDPVEGPVRAGDVLAETPIGVRVPISLYPTVGINRPNTDQWPPLVKELAGLARWVRTQAVPILIAGTAEVGPLPATYDTTVGHDDERNAIHGGSDLTASRRYSMRLSAATARVDLPDLLEAHPNKPDRKSVEGWLASLDDAAVLERMARLSRGRTVADARRTMEVLTGMLREVRAFQDSEAPDD